MCRQGCRFQFVLQSPFIAQPTEKYNKNGWIHFILEYLDYLFTVGLDTNRMKNVRPRPKNLLTERSISFWTERIRLFYIIYSLANQIEKRNEATRGSSVSTEVSNRWQIQ